MANLFIVTHCRMLIALGYINLVLLGHIMAGINGLSIAISELVTFPDTHTITTYLSVCQYIVKCIFNTQ